MDVQSEREGQFFVWDSDKAKSNVRKHGISFQAAVEVFLDPLSIEQDASTSLEQRFGVIGTTTGMQLLFVVHAEWTDEIIRIISARPATGKERIRYEDND